MSKRQKRVGLPVKGGWGGGRNEEGEGRGEGERGRAREGGKWEREWWVCGRCVEENRLVFRHCPSVA